MSNRTMVILLAVFFLSGVVGAGLFLKGPKMYESRAPENSGPNSAWPPAGASETPRPEKLELATFGGGCFWCTEAYFQQIEGVHKVVSGYSGGDVKSPTYEQVCTGTTGHAEVIQISFDPSKVAYKDLLEVFWNTHDPTTLNRQGNDVGTQYRSVIFCHDDEQRQLAERFKRELDESGAFDRPIVTEIAEFKVFYPAESYHQNYYQDNPRQQYCAYVIRPKLEKFEKDFKDKLKK